MNTIKRLILTALPFLVLAQNIAANLDDNQDGADDSIASFIDKMIEIAHQITETNTAKGLREVQAKGLKEITAFCNSVLSSLDLLSTNETLSKEERNTQAKGLYKSLFDKDLVYQAKAGKDKAVLDNAKMSAERKVLEIQGF